MGKLQNGKTGQTLPFVPAAVGEVFTRYDADMKGVGIVVCTGYSCQDRTFKFLELYKTK